MQIAYIAGPYRASTLGGIIQNIHRAEIVAIKYWQMGYAVICPHKNTSLFDGLMPDQSWLEGHLEILRRCDTIVMMTGWKQSKGAKAEHETAKWLGIKIIYE